MAVALSPRKGDTHTTLHWFSLLYIYFRILLRGPWGALVCCRPLPVTTLGSRWEDSWLEGTPDKISIDTFWNLDITGNQPLCMNVYSFWVWWAICMFAHYMFYIVNIRCLVCCEIHLEEALAKHVDDQQLLGQLCSIHSTYDIWNLMELCNCIQMWLFIYMICYDESSKFLFCINKLMFYDDFVLVMYIVDTRFFSL